MARIDDQDQGRDRVPAATARTDAIKAKDSGGRKVRPGSSATMAPGLPTDPAKTDVPDLDPTGRPVAMVRIAATRGKAPGGQMARPDSSAMMALGPMVRRAVMARIAATVAMVRPGLMDLG
jgi:hypothetical protein